MPQSPQISLAMPRSRVPRRVQFGPQPEHITVTYRLSSQLESMQFLRTEPVGSNLAIFVEIESC